MNWKRFLGASLFALLLVGGLLWASIFFLTRTKPLSSALPPPPGDITAILLAAATLMMTVFALFVAMAGILGWQGLKERVVEETNRAAHEAIERQYKVGYARLKLSIGAVYGLIYEYLRNERPSRDWGQYFLETALGQTKVAFPTLQNSEYEWIARNNLCFQMTLRGAITDAPEALEQARWLRQASSQGKAADEALMTYARAIAVFGPTLPNGEDLLREAVELVKNLRDSPANSVLLRDEATEELERLARSLQALEQQPHPTVRPVHTVEEDELGVLAARFVRAVWRRIGSRG